MSYFCSVCLSASLLLCLPEPFVEQMDRVVGGSAPDEVRQSARNTLLVLEVEHELRQALVRAGGGAGRCEGELGHRKSGGVAGNQPSEAALANLGGVLPLRLGKVLRLLEFYCTAVPDHDTRSHARRNQVFHHSHGPWISNRGLVDFLQRLLEVAVNKENRYNKVAQE